LVQAVLLDQTDQTRRLIVNQLQAAVLAANLLAQETMLEQMAVQVVVAVQKITQAAAQELSEKALMVGQEMKVQIQRLVVVAVLVPLALMEMQAQ
jgi:glycerol-3-phosphate cytidylyltransferase-like family protein